MAFGRLRKRWYRKLDCFLSVTVGLICATEHNKKALSLTERKWHSVFKKGFMETRFNLDFAKYKLLSDIAILAWHQNFFPTKFFFLWNILPHPHIDC